MANCVKCGAKRITKRRAGVFSCRHCGIQPGPTNMDRGGKPAKRIINLKKCEVRSRNKPGGRVRTWSFFEDTHAQCVAEMDRLDADPSIIIDEYAIYDRDQRERDKIAGHVTANNRHFGAETVVMAGVK